ncbi:MAG: alpha-galactosidase, partial [Ginsengibacter sp.]
ETSDVYKSENGKDFVITNGLITREFRVQPYFACFSFRNLVTGKEMIRAIQPEAAIEIDGTKYNIGGVKGQFEYGYMKYDWLEKFKADPAAFQFVDFSIKNIQPRFPWTPERWTLDKQWPPKGKEIIFYFKSPLKEFGGINVGVHYEIYDHFPLISKWISVENNSTKEITINSFKNEILSVVEEESVVGGDGQMATPHINVQSDYSFGDMTSKYADHTTYWLPDSLYTSQVNYNLQTPCLLESKPPIGPAYRLQPHLKFEAFHTYEMMYDSYDKERCGLEERKMYRILAPWATENPIFLHLTSTDPTIVKAAVDQCTATGFEMIILSFGSGLDMEDTSEANIQKIKSLVDYAHSKGIEMGGYSLFSSRSIDPKDDVINPKTGKPGGAIFGNAPCLGSQWGLDYLQKLKTFISKTGFDLLEHDGPYPGDICASTTHPGHDGMNDSQWKQWWLSISFYRELRKKDIYINAPDWYFLNGTNKIAMGYRETDWSLPRDRQVIIERQNIYDGTWNKTPSMGWTFVPLTQYHGGGAAATLEPLSEHLKDYEAHLVQNFGSGVQACYRGPRLFDTPATEALVKKEVTWYKKYRDILNSDIIHLRRADGRDWDGILHINPELKEKGLLMIYNPLNVPVSRNIKVPLYYSGLTQSAMVSEKQGIPKKMRLDENSNLTLQVSIPANGYNWYLFE